MTFRSTYGMDTGREYSLATGARRHLGPSISCLYCVPFPGNLGRLLETRNGGDRELGGNMC